MTPPGTLLVLKPKAQDIVYLAEVTAWPLLEAFYDQWAPVGSMPSASGRRWEVIAPSHPPCDLDGGGNYREELLTLDQAREQGYIP